MEESLSAALTALSVFASSVTALSVSVMLLFLSYLLKKFYHIDDCRKTRSTTDICVIVVVCAGNPFDLVEHDLLVHFP